MHSSGSETKTYYARSDWLEFFEAEVTTTKPAKYFQGKNYENWKEKRKVFNLIKIVIFDHEWCLFDTWFATAFSNQWHRLRTKGPVYFQQLPWKSYLWNWWQCKLQVEFQTTLQANSSMLYGFWISKKKTK